MATILIVDDDPADRGLVHRILGNAGHQLREAGDGAEALAQAQTEPPDLVISDLMMPTMDGFELVRQLRQNPALARTPVVFYSGTHYLESDAKALARAFGVSQVLTKPAAAQQLLDAVSQGLRVPRVKAAPAPAEEVRQRHPGLLLARLSQENGSLFAELKESLARLEAEVAERKRAQEQLDRLNSELEERVRERTAELEMANRELEAFSYSVSHDLRAPLRAVGGFARMVSQQYAASLPAEGQHQLERIRENATKMGQLIDGLLDLSRFSRQPVEKREVWPTAIVQHVLEQLQGEQAGRRVEICVRELAACQADPVLLEQVYANLLSNALKYTRRRDPARIEVGWQEDLGRRVYFVKDNGAGFEMDYAGKLFGVFQRLHRPDEFEGTGVGLAITQRIIQHHGGQIWAEAAPEKGATFYFTLNRGE